MGYASLVFYVSGTRTSLRDHPWSLSRDSTGEYSKVLSDMLCIGKYLRILPNDLNGNKTILYHSPTRSWGSFFTSFLIDNCNS